MLNLKCLPVGFIVMSICAATREAEAEEVQGPVKVFILAGQSNMQGKAAASTLEPVMADPNKAQSFQHLKTDGQWTVREDVWVTFLMSTAKGPKGNFPLYGPLTVGFGSQKTARDEHNKKVPVPGIGPELGFGDVIGDHFDEQVLLIKTAWGGKSVRRDFRPPRVMPTDDRLREEFIDIQKKNPDMTFEEFKASYGHFYREMVFQVQLVLDDLKKYFPDYDESTGFEIAGFVWFQGWNDGVGRGNPDYAEQLAQLVRDLRRELKAPELPVVIGELGVDGLEPMGWIETFRKQQAAVAAMPEFKDNVRLARTAQFWPTDLPDMSAEWAEFREKDKQQRAQAGKEGRKPDSDFFHREWLMRYKDQLSYTSDKRYHYLGSGECYYRMGEAMGKSMLELLGSR